MMVAVGSALNVDTIQRRFPMSRTMLRPNISAHLDSLVLYVTNNVLQGMRWWSTNQDFTSKNNFSHTCSQTWTSESSSWCQEVQMVCGSVTGASILRRRGRAWLITLKVDMLRAGALLAIFAQKSVPLVMQCRCMSWDSIRFSTKCDLFNLSPYVPLEFNLLALEINWFILGSFGDLDAMIDARISKTGPQTYQCMECSFNANKKSTVLNHVESKHISHGGVSCDLCGKVCATRQAYRMHKSRDHKQFAQ